MDFLGDIPETGQKCLVCSKPAQGLHYHVPSCHGCKSFFRRAILQKSNNLKCCRDGKCYSKMPFLKCRACRFQKCLDVGMIAQIGTERKSQKSNDELNTVQDVQILEWKIHDPISKIEEFVDYLSHLDKVLTKIRVSKFDIHVYPLLENLIQSPSQIGHASRFEPMSGWPLSLAEFLEKQEQLTNLKILIENEQMNESSVNINTKDWPIFETILAIEYTKTFPFFGKLGFSDRLCLIQGTAFMIHFTTAAFIAYEAKQDSFQTPDGIHMVEMFITLFIKNLTSVNIKESSKKHMHWKFVMCIMEPLLREKFTYTEYILLKAIIVTNPALDLSIEGQKIVRDERNKYARALLDLCLLNHGTVNGPARFFTVLNYISVMEGYQQFFREFITLSQLFKTTRVSKSKRKLENEILCITLK